jgi:hypothetical protein
MSISVFLRVMNMIHLSPDREQVMNFLQQFGWGSLVGLGIGYVLLWPKKTSDQGEAYGPPSRWASPSSSVPPPSATVLAPDAMMTCGPTQTPCTQQQAAINPTTDWTTVGGRLPRYQIGFSLASLPSRGVTP